MKYYSKFRSILNRVEKPGRYVGGEYGARTDDPNDSDYRVCVVFPDLYEIAMSNQAVRILYKLFNEIPGVHAERAFSAAPDFEQALSEDGQSLYSLETGTPLHRFDLLAVTIGFELAFTNLLSLLKSGDVSVRSNQRAENHPIVIAGGPAMTNPAPWGAFVDAVYIGEAEAALPSLTSELSLMKAGGATRSELLARIAAEKGFWTSNNTVENPAVRVSWPDFGRHPTALAAYPIPSMITVQDHGVIEIMRGCPNKCRFCHAGVFYRPFRQKKVSLILDEAEQLVNDCGYRDITLSSLSTGDFSGLEPLVSQLNSRYGERKVSFSLPSLRVNSVTLSLIGSVGTIRKSGLTFAVETPTIAGQRSINKEVPAEKVIEILKEAKREGWKLAKFYFMLGLPVDHGNDEVSEIVSYLNNVQRTTGINLNVNFGTFIPKPHTPFERSAQLSDQAAMNQIHRLKDALRSNKRIKFSFHSPFVSFLEGILSRGDQRAGELAYQAWLKGAHFDAWDDRMNRDAWREAIADADWDVEAEVCREKPADEVLPWKTVSLDVRAGHLRKEAQRAADAQLTVPCAEICTDHCGVCSKDCRVVIPEEILPEPEKTPDVVFEPVFSRVLIFFRKFGPAVYFGHLDVVNVFARSLQRAGIPIGYSKGFNPKPRLEFAQPLSLGLHSEQEVCTVYVARDTLSTAKMKQRLNSSLPSGFEIVHLSWIADAPKGRKTRKVMSAFWGSDWLVSSTNSHSMNSHLTNNLSDTESPARALRAETQHLMEKLIQESQLRAVQDDFEAVMESDAIRIHFHHGGTKNHNLQNLLEAVLGPQPLAAAWTVTRLRSWAKGGQGEALPYEEVFAESQ